MLVTLGAQQEMDLRSHSQATVSEIEKDRVDCAESKDVVAQREFGTTYADICSVLDTVGDQLAPLLMEGDHFQIEEQAIREALTTALANIGRE